MPKAPPLPKLRQPIKRHGGKSYLAKWIVSKMPPRCRNPNAPMESDTGWLHYAEPYFGGGAVLFANDPHGISEVVNDLDGELTNFWDVLKSPSLFTQLQSRLALTPCSAVEFDRAVTGFHDHCQVDRAAAFFVRNRQSRQGLERDFATLARTRTRGGMNELPSAWLSAIDGLPQVHHRLQRVVILNGDAIKVIKQQDGPRTLFYCDPPYVHSTRKTTKEYGANEMTDDQHTELLETLAAIKGRFILSGYSNDLYYDFAQEQGWSCDSVEIDNKASGAKFKKKERECLWMNYV